LLLKKKNNFINQLQTSYPDKITDAIINAKNTNGDTPFTLALSRSAPEFIKTILTLSKHININVKNVQHFTPLHTAAIHNNLNLAKVLIDKGAQVDVLDAKGRTPLLCNVRPNNMSFFYRL